MTYAISGIYTDTMAYVVGQPMPMPPGYDVEPFIVVRIIPVAGGMELPDPSEFGSSEEPQDPPETSTPVESTESDPEPEESDTEESGFMVLAEPDMHEVKIGQLPKECPDKSDPNWVYTWPKAVNYNRKAHRYSREGYRIVSLVTATDVKRIDRLMGTDEYEGLKTYFQRKAQA